jgi:hypothetical protein
MKEYGKVQSVQQPEPKVIDDYSVWIATNITPVTKEPTGDGDAGFSGYEYDLTQYDKDEYITMMDEKAASLEEELTSTQMALCDVYELVG